MIRRSSDSVNHQSSITNERPDEELSMSSHAATVDAHSAEEEYTNTGIPHDKMGMWVFLCSEVMFFTGLIGSYIVLRFASPFWPQPSTVLNVPLTAVNTFILICSSVTMVQALGGIRAGNPGKMKL